jgi:hypothetical protein
MSVRAASGNAITSGTRQVVAYLEKLTQDQFWGNLTLKFQAGNVIHVLREESLKPEQLIPDYREDYGTVVR